MYLYESPAAAVEYLRIVQTNIQLYNQLIGAGRADSDLETVRACYELARKRYSGYYQADGKTFVAHGCGVASIVASLGLPGDMVGAACIHNIYGNGDFADARKDSASTRRRRLVRQAVGMRVEELVYHFRVLLRSPGHPALELGNRLQDLSDTDRMLLAIELADTLEICMDLGPLYYGDGSRMIDYVTRHGDQLVVIAQALGHPQLSQALSVAFAALLSGSVPARLRSSDPIGNDMSLCVPPSCALRTRVVLRKLWRALRSRLRVRRWLRAVFSSAARS